MSAQSEATAQQRLERARLALAAVQTRMGTSRDRWDSPTLPVASSLAEVLPLGLKRGQILAVQGSTSLVLALVAEASREGSWAAVIGVPQVGVVAAARRGIELARLALIPHPGAQAPAVAGACVDGMDVVVLGPRLVMSDADRRRLAARARERGTVIVSAGPWTGAHITMGVESARWSGLGAGDGRLRSRDVVLAVTSRAGGPTRRVALTLDEDVAVRPGVRTPAPSAPSALSTPSTLEGVA